MIALGCGITPGIDLEQLRSRPRALAIARRFFSVDEVRMLEAVTPSQRSAAFLQVWTAKEAVLKAHGRGLAFGLDRLSIDCGTDGPRLQRMEGEDVATWQLLSLASDAPVIAALAWRGAARRVRHFGLVDAGE
jgi:4'-phosphopantetheinyl transferase